MSKVVEQQVFASIQCKQLAALVTNVPRVWLAQQMVRQVKRGASHDLVHREGDAGSELRRGVEDVSAGVCRRRAC